MKYELNPNEMFYSEIIEVDGLDENEKKPIYSNLPIEIRINSGEWIKIKPSNQDKY